MKKCSTLATLVSFFVLVVTVSVATAAYQHAGDADTDAKVFLTVYPHAAGTKLDNCALCHAGGIYTSGGKSTAMGSCQYCHAITNYGKQLDQFAATLNPFGRDYLSNGRNEAALKAIESLDSDGDGYSNLVEISAIRYPGYANDDPTKVAAPFRIFTKAQLEAMPQHSQFMLMNTTKSGDYYAEYSGVVMENILKAAKTRADATKITVYAPDGYSISHPLLDDTLNIGASYAPYVMGTYPQARYYYNEVADKAMGGWCDYTSPGNAVRGNGDPIYVNDGLRFILALRADNKDLVPGYLDSTNKLATGTEGPFRTVTPQKIVGPPDQPSNKNNASLIWPYDANADHNAGFSSKSATIIKVEPLPEGTTDIDVLEAGWNYVDSGKIVVYGDIDPLPNILDKLSTMIVVVQAADTDAFSHRGVKRELIQEIYEARMLLEKKHYRSGLYELQRELLPRLEQCNQTDRDYRSRRYGDKYWIIDCDLQQKLLWSLQEVITLLKIVI